MELSSSTIDRPRAGGRRGPCASRLTLITLISNLNAKRFMRAGERQTYTARRQFRRPQSEWLPGCNDEGFDAERVQQPAFRPQIAQHHGHHSSCHDVQPALRPSLSLG